MDSPRVERSDGFSARAARAGARRGAPPGATDRGEAPCAWLAELGPAPIRLTPLNTTVAFSVRWLGGLLVRGTFASVRGTLHVPDGDTAAAAVSVEIDADSVRTGISLRDRHLRGPQFLDAARHPVIAFVGGNVMRWPTHLAVPGSLTIRGITRTEELRCDRTARADVLELLAAVAVSRRSFDVGAPRGLRRLDPLFVVIGDEVRIEVRITI